MKTSSATAVYAGSPRLAPGFYQDYSIYRGYQNNDAAWFISTSASSIAFAGSTFFATVWNPWFPQKPILAPQMLLPALQRLLARQRHDQTLGTGARAMSLGRHDLAEGGGEPTS